MRGSLIGGAFLTAITMFFLLGLKWLLFWPEILIGIGLAMILNGVLPIRPQSVNRITNIQELFASSWMFVNSRKRTNMAFWIVTIVINK